MDTSIYRIRTDGTHFACEIHESGSWHRVAFQYGNVYAAGAPNAVTGEFYKSEEELIRVIESVIGTSARRVREWRTV